MKKWFLQVLPFVASLLGVDLEAKEQLELSEEQKGKLDKESGIEGFADAFMKYYNEEYITEEKQTKQAFEQFMAEFNASKPEVTGSESEEEGAEPKQVPEADAKTAGDQLRAVIKKAQGLLKTNAQLAADNEKLKAMPEDDAPEAIQLDPKKAKVKHSSTHLFASNNPWDSLERPWNKAAADGKIKSATTWDKVNIDKLNEDLGAYSRRNANEIMSMIRDGYDLPSHWPVVSNVQDEYIFTSIATGEITQGFKKGWLPKNKQRFVPIKNKVFSKQIDITWAPSELKSIEKSWLNMFFNEGSTPYKMSFARYLISEILKKARKEDKIALFKAVYFDTEGLPEGVAGSFLNALDGFLKIISDHRGTSYKAHSLPKLTPANTYDVIQDWLENKIPIDIRNLPGLKLGLGNDVHRWYYKGRELQKGVYQDYEKDVTSPEDFPNIEFTKHPQLEGSGFIYLTTDDNIGIMVDRPGEESMLTMEMVKREINAFGDYKQGVFFKAFGAKVDPNAEITYEDQIFFSNDVQLLDDVYTPVAADDATPSVADHHALVIGSNNTGAVNLTQLDDVVAGTRYFLRGDADTNITTVKNGANILLQGGADFALNNGNVIELIGLSGGKVIEYSRTVAGEVPEPDKVVLAADATTADAEAGTHFITQANTGATAITNITNAVEDEVYTIEGGSATNSTTIANGGNFLLNGTFTASVGAYLKVQYNGSKFVEIERG